MQYVSFPIYHVCVDMCVAGDGEFGAKKVESAYMYFEP